MAIVSVQVHVSSVAVNGDYKGKVVQGWETFSINIKGESITKKRLWTFWLNQPTDLVKGDVVEFHGELGTKAAEYVKDGKTYNTVEHSLNDVRFNVIQKLDPGKVVVETPSGESPF